MQFGVRCRLSNEFSKHNMTFSHLMFADDTMLFGKATVQEAEGLAVCMKTYEDMSGQRVNQQKSAILFSKNTASSLKEDISEILHYKSGSGTMRYLGIPLGGDGRDKERWSHIVDRVHAKLNGWRGKTLAQASKVSLLKHVVSSIPTYSMSCFKLPKKYNKKMDGMMRRFWWGGNEMKKHILCTKAWQDICLPKYMGGLGLREMEKTNISLLAKLSWNMAKQSQKLWVQCLSKKYNVHHLEDLLSYSKKQTDSELWKGILKGRHILQEGLCWQVLNGKSIRIWDYPWIPSIRDFKPVKKHIEVNSNVQWVFELMNSDKCSWNIEMLEELFSANTVIAIQKIPLCNSQEDDRLIWSLEKDGQFSARSAYKSMVKNSSSSGNMHEMVDWSGLWKLNIQARLKMMMWKSVAGVLKTKDVISKFMFLPAVEKMCVLCGLQEESVNHIFLRCDVVRYSWRLSSWSTVVDNFQDKPFHEWIKVVINPKLLLAVASTDMHKFQIFAAVIIDLLWMTRNQIMHDKKIFQFVELQQMVNRAVRDHYKVWKPGIKEQSLESWCAPPLGFVKGNFDVAVRQGVSYISAVLCDDMGNIIEAITQQIQGDNPVIGEALAAGLVVKTAVKHKVQKLIVEGDSSIVCEAIANPRTLRHWDIHGVVQSIVVQLQGFSTWRAVKIPRGLNTVAHELAAKAALVSSTNCMPVIWQEMKCIWVYLGGMPP